MNLQLLPSDRQTLSQGTRLAKHGCMIVHRSPRALSRKVVNLTAAVVLGLGPSSALGIPSSAGTGDQIADQTVGQVVNEALANPELRAVLPPGIGRLSPSARYEKILQAFKVYQGKVNTSVTSDALEQVAKGGVGSGGGTGYRGGLLDLALYNRAAFEDTTPGMKLPETRAFKIQTLGFDRLSKDFPLMQKAIAQVRKWAPASPELAPRLILAIESMPVYFVRGELMQKPYEFVLPKGSEINPSELSTIGTYFAATVTVVDQKNQSKRNVRLNFGNLTSKSRLEALSEKNQIAYVIHEAGRHLQIGHRTLMGNDTIQRLTAKIMSDPGPNETLDTPEFLAGPILAQRLAWQGTMLKLMHESTVACETDQILCDMADVRLEGQSSAEQRLALGQRVSEGADQMARKRREMMVSGKSDGTQITEADLRKNILRENLVRNVANSFFMGALNGVFTEPRFQEADYSIARMFNYDEIDAALAEVNKSPFFERSKLLMLEDIARTMSESLWK